MTKALLNGSHEGTFLDIGANFGYFSVLWLSISKGDLLAIEPIRQNSELLTANLQSFGSRAKTVMCCLGDRHDEVIMSYDPQYPMLAKVGGNSGGNAKGGDASLNASSRVGKRETHRGPQM
jgi:FkbM family methyltransferase